LRIRDRKGEFSIVYDDIEELPLRVNFPLASRTESAQPRRAAEARKDRFDRTESLAISASRLWSIDSPFHFRCVDRYHIDRPAREKHRPPHRPTLGNSRHVRSGA